MRTPSELALLKTFYLPKLKRREILMRDNKIIAKAHTRKHHLYMWNLSFGAKGGSQMPMAASPEVYKIEI